MAFKMKDIKELDSKIKDLSEKQEKLNLNHPPTLLLVWQ